MRTAAGIALALMLLASAAAADPTGTCALFGAPITSGSILSMARVTVGDFNEDGILDLAGSSNGLNFPVMLGLGSGGVGNGQFAAPVNYATTSVRDVTLGDFNHDGITDIAATIPSGLAVRLGLGSFGVGNGAFGSELDYPFTSQNPVLTLDVNEDGIQDVVGGGGNSPYFVQSLRGNGTNGVGNGTFNGPFSTTVVAVPGRLVAGDFNEDGRTDLAMTAGGNAIVTLLGTGTGPKGDGGFGSAALYIVNSISGYIASGDFNEDGRTDLAFTESAGDVAVMLGNGTGTVGDGTFAAPQRYWVGRGPRGLAVGDLTGDGVADLAIALQFDSLAVMLGGGVGSVGNGTFGFPQRFKCAPGPRAVAIRDFVKDGVPDVLVANYDTTAVQVFAGTCAPFVPTGVAVTAPNGGEAWTIGSEHTISFSRGEGVIALDIELTRDGGANWDPIATNVTDSSFAWTVTGPQTGLARIRVHDSTVLSRQDRSDTTFVIDPNVNAVEGRASRLALGVAPNPFSRSVRVMLTVPRRVGGASVVVCGVDGRVVARLHDGTLGAGTRTLEWDGRLVDGRRAAPGVYFVRATLPGEGETTQRAVLLE